MNNNIKSTNRLGLFIMLGLVALGVALILTVKTAKSYDRCVTVKGLCEKEMMADKVIWPIVYKQGGNELTALYKDINNKNDAIISFLKAAGITEQEITINAPTIVDTRTNTYSDNATYNYIVTSVITVCSENVELVVKMQTEQMKLYEQGIPVGTGDSWQYPTVYSFTKLNDVKPSMIEEATVNARQAAEKFAKDSKSKLGKIKTATQGQFSVTDRDSNTPYIKNVRVVTNVVYYLKD